MTNYYAPGEVHIHRMTEAEKKAERRSQEERRKKYPWRYSGKKTTQEYACYANEQKRDYANGKKRR